MAQDHLNKLPDELLIEIVSYLEPRAVWGLRRVSRRLAGLLPDDLVQQDAIRRFEACLPPGQPKSFEDSLQTMKAVACGIPYAVCTVAWDSCTWDGSGQFVIRGDLFAFASRGRVLLHNICTGRAANYAAGGSRYQVLDLVLTDTTLAYITEHYFFHCQLVDFKESPSFHYRRSGSRIAGHRHFILVLDKQLSVFNTLTKIETVVLGEIPGTGSAASVYLNGQVCLIAQPQTTGVAADVLCLHFSDTFELKSSRRFTIDHAGGYPFQWLLFEPAGDDWLVKISGSKDIRRLIITPFGQHWFDIEGDVWTQKATYGFDSTETRIVIHRGEMKHHILLGSGRPVRAALVGSDQYLICACLWPVRSDVVIYALKPSRTDLVVGRMREFDRDKPSVSYRQWTAAEAED